MEASSLFEDLVYSIEIAGHGVGLQHYHTRMLLDTSTLRREYRELFVPEEWEQPYLARAEVSLELDALAEARMQLSPEEVAEAFGLLLPEDVELEAPSLLIELEISFMLDLYHWTREHDDLERWYTYLTGISAREKLEAGLRNLRGEVRRALIAAGGHGEGDWDPTLDAAADTALEPGRGLLAKTLTVQWSATLNTGLDDEDFTSELEAIMGLVRAGIEATRAFQEEIQRDYENIP